MFVLIPPVFICISLTFFFFLFSLPIFLSHFPLSYPVIRSFFSLLVRLFFLFLRLYFRPYFFLHVVDDAVGNAEGGAVGLSRFSAPANQHSSFLPLLPMVLLSGGVDDADCICVTFFICDHRGATVALVGIMSVLLLVVLFFKLRVVLNVLSFGATLGITTLDVGNGGANMQVVIWC